MWKGKGKVSFVKAPTFDAEWCAWMSFHAVVSIAAQEWMGHWRFLCQNRWEELPFFEVFEEWLRACHAKFAGVVPGIVEADVGVRTKPGRTVKANALVSAMDCPSFIPE
jgi:hypothetical protein